MYQGPELHRYDEALSYFTAHYEEYCTSVTSCLKSRLAWSDLQMIRDVILVLACQGWEKILNDDYESTEATQATQAVIRLGSRFQVSLTSAGVEIEPLHEEFLEMISYADQFISIATLYFRLSSCVVATIPLSQCFFMEEHIRCCSAFVYTSIFKWKA